MPNYMVTSGGKKFKVTMDSPPDQAHIDEMLKGQVLPESIAAPTIPHKSNAERTFDIRMKKMAPFDSLITKHAADNGLDPNLIKAMILTESNKDVSPESTNSKSSATGLGQITKGTAKHLGITDPTDPDQNIMGIGKYIAENYDRFNGDLDKTVVAYHDGPAAVKKYEKDYGADWKKGISEEGQEHISRFNNYLTTLGGAKSNRAPQPLYELDTREMAGLPPLRYPNKDASDPANVLYDNPEAQAQAVQDSRKQMIADLPLREQMGSGVGAFAYKMPGMGTIAELSGLAPKGSAKDKAETIRDYNQNRTAGQMAGEMLPDVLISSLGGAAASKALQLSKIGKVGFTGAKALMYGTEGAVAGGVSAAGHQAQHIGSGEKFQGKEAAAEVIGSALLGTLGGKLGDKLVEVAPKILRRSLKPTLHESTATNPPDYTAALENDLIPKSGNLEKAAARSEAKLASLESDRAIAAKAASQEPIPPPGVPAPKVYTPPKVLPTKPIVPPQPTNLSQLAPKPVVPPSNPTPGYFPLTPEQQAAKRTAMIEADKARRIAEATARRNAEVSPQATAQQKALAQVNGPSKQVDLSSLASKQAALKEVKPKVTIKEDKGYSKADQKLLDEAFGAEKELALQKKLKGQRGSLDLFPDKEKGLDKMSTAEQAAQEKPFPNKQELNLSDLGKKDAFKEMVKNNLPKESRQPFNVGNSEGMTKDFRSQRGAIPNPFAKSSKPATQLPMREVKKIGFIDGPLKSSRDALDKEIANPTTNKFTSETYDDAKSAFDHWEKEAMKRPTVKGHTNAQMTVEDALSFRQAIDKEIKFRKTQGTLTDGFNKASLMVREDLNKTIAKEAPEVGRLTDEQAKILPFKKSLDTRVEKNLNTHIPTLGIKLSGLAGGALLGAGDSKNRKSSMITGALGGLTLAQLATTPGGAAILFKTGKALADQTSIKKRVAAQLIRSATVKSREKK